MDAWHRVTGPREEPRAFGHRRAAVVGGIVVAVLALCASAAGLFAAGAATPPDRLSELAVPSPDASHSAAANDPCGVAATESEARRQDVGASPIDTESFVGLTLDEAEARAEGLGLQMRVLGRDGECDVREELYEGRRVTVYVVRNVVEAAGQG